MEEPVLSRPDAAAVIRALGLAPHPEGGHYRETFRDPRTDAAGRPASTAIYYLLGAGETSEWHRVDAAEAWHFHAGAPLVLTVSPNGHDAAATHLGADPGLASLYDAALFGMNWGVLSGFLHAAALVGAEGVGATEFASVATGYLPFVTGLLPDIARQIEEGRYPNDDGALEVHAAAMDHLIHTSLDHGIGADVPKFVKDLHERGIAAGHGADGMASLIEVVRSPASAA